MGSNAPADLPRIADLPRTGDAQRKIFLASLLPDVIDDERDKDGKFLHLIWRSICGWPLVKDTELLHLCQRVEKTVLTAEQYDDYQNIVGVSSDWWFRVEKFASVLNRDIGAIV